MSNKSWCFLPEKNACLGRVSLQAGRHTLQERHAKASTSNLTCQVPYQKILTEVSHQQCHLVGGFWLGSIPHRFCVASLASLAILALLASLALSVSWLCWLSGLCDFVGFGGFWLYNKTEEYSQHQHQL